MSDVRSDVEAFIREKGYSSKTDIESISDGLLEKFPCLEDDLSLEELDQVVADVLTERAAADLSAKQNSQKKEPSPKKKNSPPRKRRPHPEDPKDGKGAPAPFIQAPYRFVALEKTVVPAQSAADISRPGADRLDASLDVDWAAETPILIGQNGKEEDNENGIAVPMRLDHLADQAHGQEPYIIPGATLRGLIRSAVEIVALGRLGFINGHHRYGLRDFTHPAYAEESPVGKIDEVRAGWLTCDGDPQDRDSVWSIAEIGGRGWSCIEIDTLLSDVPHMRRGDVGRIDWINKPLEKKYAALKMVGHSANGKEEIYDFSVSKSFSSSRQGENKSGSGVRTPPYIYRFGTPGVVVCSDEFKVKTINKTTKKYEYVFHGQPGEPVHLDKDIVEAFRRLYCKPSANKPTPDGTYKKLVPTLKVGKRVPVFFVGDLGTDQHQGEGFFFGFTRLFKILHEQSVQQVLEKVYPAHRPDSLDDPLGTTGEAPVHVPDFVENLFGWVVEPKDLGAEDGARVATGSVAHKGRIAFGLARMMPDQSVVVKGPLKTVSMGPKASFAPFYLANSTNDGELDYSPQTGSVTLAGRKRYLPRKQTRQQRAEAWQDFERFHHDMEAQITKGSRGKPLSDDVFSKLKFLCPANSGTDLHFASTIKLKNVTPEELGAVLYALTHGGDPHKPYRHLIGRGKPWGAGQVRVASVRLQVKPHLKNKQWEWCLPPTDDEVLHTGRAGAQETGFFPAEQTGRPSHSPSPFVRAFIAYMRQQPALQAYPDIPSLREFFGASCVGIGAQLAADGRLGYMTLDDHTRLKKAYVSTRKEWAAPIRAANKKILSDQDKDNRILPAPRCETVPKGAGDL